MHTQIALSTSLVTPHMESGISGQLGAGIINYEEGDAMVRLVLIFFVLLLLGGCSHPLQSPPLNRNIVVHLKLVEDIPEVGREVAATTTCHKSWCVMKIKKDYYPRCVVEEVGKITHQQREVGSTTYCYYK